MNPDNQNETLHLDEVQAQEACDKAIRAGDWITATKIQEGDLRKGTIPPGAAYKVTREAKDER